MADGSLDLLQGTLDLLILNNRRAKYYEITTKGPEALTKEASAWSSFPKAVSTVLTSADRPAWAK